jgi:hypothetical protein
MSLSKIVWLLGGASVVAVSAAGLQACSSSSASPAGAQDSGASMQDSSTSGDTGSGSGGDSSMAVDTGSGDDGGGDSGTCEKPPSLFMESTPGVYCPFSDADGGGNITCQPGEHCCETPASAGTPSTCLPAGTACPVANSVDWECEEAIDCTAFEGGGPVCCGTGSPTTATHCGVTWPEWTGFTGTKCMASCPAPGITVCEQQSDCAGDDAGTTCKASKANGNDFGFCSP